MNNILANFDVENEYLLIVVVVVVEDEILW
jgi:hypothetical protein